MNLVLDVNFGYVQHFTELYDKQTLCNVEFYFNTMLLFWLPEIPSSQPCIPPNERNKNKTGLEIQDIQPDAFDELLHFIYSGKIKKYPYLKIYSTTPQLTSTKSKN